MKKLLMAFIFVIIVSFGYTFPAYATNQPENKLMRLDISVSKLSKSALILDKPFSFIETYKVLVIVTALVFFLLLVLIFSLMFYIRKIKRMRGELQVSNSKLSDLYEDIASADEELKSQFDELNSTQEHLSASEERFRLVVDATNDGIWDWNIITDEIYLSEKWYDMMGYNSYSFDTHKFWSRLIHPDDKEKALEARQKHFSHETDIYDCEFRLKQSSGEYIWIHTRGKAQFDSNGNPVRMIGSHTDISELKEYQEELHYLAYHDTLTGLYNRFYLYDLIGMHLDDAKYLDSIEAMLFIDADNFKFINDSLGHAFGDKVVVEIAMRLLSLCDENSSLFRLGSDEFVLYAKNITDREYIEKLAQKIIRAFNEPLNINNSSVNLTASVGIAIFPEHGQTVDALLRSADIAMYKVKEKGKNGYSYFDDSMKVALMERVNIEKYFKKAIDNDEFIVYYQPQVNIETKKPEAFEALIRWQSPELGGLVSPLKFINIAEETGFIIQLGEWILRTSCKFINDLNKRKSAQYKISVNISVIQLLQDNFIDMVNKILQETGLPPTLLELEITESIIMDSPELVMEKFKFLRDKGISIALDDFGTGYSSLAYLRTIPISTLKIDKVFIDDITGIDCSNAVTDTIIDLGHKMGLTIVAEGVETTGQLEYLAKNRCDKLQGYLFYKPLPTSDLEKIL